MTIECLIRGVRWHFIGLGQEAAMGRFTNQLSRLGYIRTIRGIGGGIELARKKEEIRVGEVVEAFEGNLHLLE